MRFTHWIGGGITAAVVGTAVAFAAPALATTTVPTDGDGANHCFGFGQLYWSKAPDDLKADLRAAVTLPEGEQRRTALKEVRATELSGGYGPGVQEFAENRQSRWVWAWRHAPSDLTADVRALRNIPAGEERHDAAEDIFQKALDGGYGPATQARAEQRQECRADG